MFLKQSENYIPSINEQTHAYIILPFGMELTSPSTWLISSTGSVFFPSWETLLSLPSDPWPEIIKDQAHSTHQVNRI